MDKEKLRVIAFIHCILQDIDFQLEHQTYDYKTSLKEFGVKIIMDEMKGTR